MDPRDHTEAQQIIGQLIASASLNEAVWNDGDMIEDLLSAAEKVGLEVPDFQEHNDMYKWAKEQEFTTVNETSLV